MKTNWIKSTMVVTGLSAVMGTARAQDSLQNESSAWSRVGISYRAAFNIKADFTGLGGYVSPNQPGVPGPTPTTGGPGTIVRTYDDGFIGVDISGNVGGTTTYWGYNSDAQSQNDTILMHNSSSPATATSGGVDDGVQHGLELSCFQRLGGEDRWHWGVEGALNWTPVGIRDSRTLSGNVITMTHAFALNGVIPPLTPPAYVGTVNGPGAPQLGTDATDAGTSTQAGAATISGARQIDADVFGVRIGPFVEWDLSERFSLELSGGFSTAIVNSRFDYNSLVSIGGVDSQSGAGTDQSSDWIFGGYVRGQLGYRLSKSVAVFVGGEFNSMSDSTQSSGSARARLDFGSTVYVTSGLNWTF